MFHKYRNKIIFSVILGAIVFLGLSIYANFNELLLAFGSFKWVLFPVVLLLSLGNYIARYFKWEYYTNILQIPLKRKLNFSIFLSSFIMSITPGKIGEVFKSYLVKEQVGTPISKSAPIVIAERITDFLSLILLSIFGAITFGYGTDLIIGVAIVFLLIIILLSSRKLSLRIITFFEKFHSISKASHRIHTAYESIYQMISIKALSVAILISVIAWSFECIGFYIVINSFGIENLLHINIFVATFIYGFATIVGAITMLPGGLGATDASITGLLVILQIPKNISVASTLIIRIATLWFAVIVGIAAVLFYQKLTHNKVSNVLADA